MKQIFVIRHGETDNNKAHIIQGRGLDASINEFGRLQAKAIADALKEYDIQRIICSGLKRTHETAEPLASQYQLDIEKYPELDEINFGILEGQSFKEIKDQVMEVHDEWRGGNVDYAPENGESPRAAFARANGKAEEVLEQASEDTIAFVVHGRLIRILLSVWLGYGLKNMHKVEHQNGAINHLTWNKGEFKAVELNSVDHLHELA